MNNLKKILMCLSLVVCLCFSVACGGNDSPDDTSQDNSSADNVTDDNNSSNDAVEVTDEDGNTITTTLADSENISEENYVTDADGSVVTDANGNVFVTEAVTNSDGSVVTDDSGNTVTQKVTVTTTANNNNNNTANNTDSNSANNNASTQADSNASNDNSNNNTNNNSNGNNTNDNSNNDNNNATTTVANNNQVEGNNNQTNAVLTVTENNGNIVATTTTADNSPYFAKNRYSAFTWMSEDTKNVYNSGEIVQITFKVLDGAKAGTYPIEISYTDISNEKAELLTFPAINGTITVGDTNKVEPQGAASSTSFRLDNGYAKVGDTVTLKMYLDNNPGISIFQVEFKYDNNALEVQSITPSGIFANESILSNMNFNLT